MDHTIDFDAARKGLAAGEFFLEYQPIVSLADGRCVGGEALARWRRPAGAILAADFIPIVEGTPLSGLMTYWVIDTVAAEMGEWLRANPEACISMNVPPEVLGRGGLEYAATKSGLRDVAGQIILEITERGIPDLLGVQALNLMPGSGVRVALDDVTLLGGGQLAVLARCNFNIIKIDISLVAQISAQSPHPEWLDGLTAVLESTQLTVIAEGVETEQQLATLRKARVQWAQGFHFSRAIPAAEFIAFHRDFRA